MMFIDREELIVAILRREPGLNGHEISERLLARYRFKGFGALAELGKLSPILAKLERDRRVWSQWADEPYPRRRQYFAVAG